MRVLVVEDDRRLAAVLQRGLTEDGHRIDLCDDGIEAAMLAATGDYDAIILDVMLPGKDGFEVCRDLRRRDIQTPILILTARDTVDDTVQGLEAGADDYLKKPFAFRELRARLQSITRRRTGGNAPVLTVGDLTLDMDRREVKRAGRTIALTNREYQVLAFLMQEAGRVVTRLMIEDRVWGYAGENFSNTVDVHIKRLRQKLDIEGKPSPIETIRGAGYRLAAGGQ